MEISLGNASGQKVNGAKGLSDESGYILYNLHTSDRAAGMYMLYLYDSGTISIRKMMTRKYNEQKIALKKRKVPARRRPNTPRQGNEKINGLRPRALP